MSKTLGNNQVNLPNCELVRQPERPQANIRHRLAGQLNTKDTRFIYELIQNADDNHYPDGVEPFPAFKLHEECLTIESNEVSFTPENITASSKIAHSAKERKAGYISSHEEGNFQGWSQDKTISSVLTCRKFLIQTLSIGSAKT